MPFFEYWYGSLKSVEVCCRTANSSQPGSEPDHALSQETALGCSALRGSKALFLKQFASKNTAHHQWPTCYNLEPLMLQALNRLHTHCTREIFGTKSQNKQNCVNQTCALLHKHKQLYHTFSDFSAVKASTQTNSMIQTQQTQQISTGVTWHMYDLMQTCSNHSFHAQEPPLIVL